MGTKTLTREESKKESDYLRKVGSMTLQSDNKNNEEIMKKAGAPKSIIKTTSKKQRITDDRKGETHQTKVRFNHIIKYKLVYKDKSEQPMNNAKKTGGAVWDDQEQEGEKHKESNDSNSGQPEQTRKKPNMKKQDRETQKLNCETETGNRKQPCNNKQKHKRRIRKKKTNKLRILYSNVNGIKDKVASLETTTEALEIDIVAIAETKQKPPRLQGFGKWRSTERKGRAGGGVGVCAKESISNKLTKVTNLEQDDNNQDVVWTELTKTKNKKFYIGCYYGKQEKENENEIRREFQLLSSQISMLKTRGEIMLATDANAKLEIKDGKYQQELSRNGKYLKELTEEHNLIVVSLNSKTGKWTRKPRTTTEKESIIDYVLMTPELAKQVTEISIDEAGAYRIKGQKETDHNTIIVELNIDIPIEKKKIKRWDLNNKEGWKKYNQELRTKYEQQKPKTQAKLQELITETMKKTVGMKTITLGGNKVKETEEIKELRREKNEKKALYERALKNNRQDVPDIQRAYFQDYFKLLEAIELNKKEKNKEKNTKLRKTWSSQDPSLLEKESRDRKGNARRL